MPHDNGEASLLFRHQGDDHAQGNLTFPNLHNNLPNSITNGNWFGKGYRVITLKRAVNAGIWNIKERGGRSDFHKKATLNNDNPFEFFLPCLDHSLKEFNSAFTHYGLNPQELQNAHNIILAHTGTNKELIAQLVKIDKKLVQYLLSAALNQYDRRDDDPVTKAYSFTDNYTLEQYLDLAGTHPRIAEFFGNNSKHLCGEFAAIIERTLFYKGISYEADSKDPTKFSYLYKDPDDKTNGKPLEVFSGKYDKEKHMMTLKLGSNLSDEAFAQGLQQMLVFSAQYAQQNNSNTFPVTLGKNPERNIFIVMQAIGEFGLNVPISPTDKQKILDQIKAIPDDPANPNKKQQLEDLWNFACDRAELIAPQFKWDKQRINVSQVDPQFLNNPDNNKPLKSVNEVKDMFRQKLANSDLSKKFSINPQQPTTPQAAYTRSRSSSSPS